MHVISQNKHLWPNLCVSLFSCPIAIQAQRHFEENYLHVCLLLLLQETGKSHSSFLKPFLITTRDSISSDSCLFPGVPKKKRPDSFWVSWVPNFCQIFSKNSWMHCPRSQTDIEVLGNQSLTEFMPLCPGQKKEKLSTPTKDCLKSKCIYVIRLQRTDSGKSGRRQCWECRTMMKCLLWVKFCHVLPFSRVNLNLKLKGEKQSLSKLHWQWHYAEFSFVIHPSSQPASQPARHLVILWKIIAICRVFYTVTRCNFAFLCA